MTWAVIFPIDIFFFFSRSKYKETIIIQAYMLCVLDLSGCFAYRFIYVLDESRCTYDIERERGGGGLIIFVWMINFLKANLRIGRERFERCWLWHLRYLFDSRKTRTLQWHSNCEAGADHKVVVHYLSLLNPRSKGVQVSLFCDSNSNAM